MSGSCVSTSCGDPNSSDPLTNGSWDLTSALDGVTINGTCDSGFGGNPSITCNSGSYVVNSNVCSNASCAFLSKTWSGIRYDWNANVFTNVCVTQSNNPGSFDRRNKCCSNGLWYYRGSTAATKSMATCNALVC